MVGNSHAYCQSANNSKLMGHVGAVLCPLRFIVLDLAWPGCCKCVPCRFAPRDPYWDHHLTHSCNDEGLVEVYDKCGSMGNHSVLQLIPHGDLLLMLGASMFSKTYMLQIQALQSAFSQCR